MSSAEVRALSEVVWSGTSVSTGRFSPVEVKSTEDELYDRFWALNSRGEGYLEVRAPDREFPVVTIGFRDGRAVIHCADGPETMALLHGDNSVPSGEGVEVLIMDDPVEFMGEFVLTLDHAWDIIKDFLRSHEVRALGDWVEM